MTAPVTDPEEIDEATPEGEPEAEPQPETDQLGDAGKKALDAMKAKWRAERDKAKALQAQLEERLAKDADLSDKPDFEAMRKAADREATTAANQRANERILRSEVRAAATGKMANPALALRLLNLTDFEVDDDGNVDEQEIKDAIAKLVEENPGLGVTQGEPRRFHGSADGGAKGTAGKPQMTKAEVEKLYREGKSEKIEAARQAGLLDDLLGVKKS